MHGCVRAHKCVCVCICEHVYSMSVLYVWVGTSKMNVYMLYLSVLLCETEDLPLLSPQWMKVIHLMHCTVPVLHMCIGKQLMPF